jgi:carbon starvation protein
VAPKLIFNQQLDGWLTIIFSVIVWLVILDMLRVAIRAARGQPTLASSEAPHVARISVVGGSGS